MKREEIFTELNVIFKNVFNNQKMTISETSKAAEIDDWDSLNHAALIAAIEGHFEVKFKLMELMEFNDVGKIITSLEMKLPK